MRAIFVLATLWVMQASLSEESPLQSDQPPAYSRSGLLSSIFCFDGSLQGTCLEIIVNQICRYGNYTTNEAQKAIGESGKFYCEGIGCKISTLQGIYCKPQGFLPMHQFLRPSRGGNNNIDGACARNVNQNTYRKVEEVAGIHCVRKLRSICNNCLPPGMAKNMLLEKMLLDTYNKLRNTQDSRPFIRSTKVNSTAKNFPRNG